MREHLTALQNIANANGGTRFAGSPGYDASAEYVYNALASAGYSPVRQYFDFDFYEETAPPVLQRTSPNPITYAVDTDFVTYSYSGSGDVTARLQATNDIVIPPGSAPSTSNSGCEAADFAGFVPGNIALIQRGTCDFGVKAKNATAAGASGVVMFNEGQPGRTDVLLGSLGSPQSIPYVGTTFGVGESLYNLLQSGPVTMHLATTTFIENRTTYNVYADTGGRADRTVVVGAHLDSVTDGSGINDNGSGSAMTLEIAEQMKQLNINPANRVRFAWWSAEEAGTFGSEHYVSVLSAQDVKNTMANLTFDMVASPNYIRAVYDGDGKDTPPCTNCGPGPNGSGNIEQIFMSYFKSQSLSTIPTELDGRSDYAAFSDAGIPVGGLFSGAEDLKTAEEASLFGGTAGAPHDACYHQACDTLANINNTVFKQMSDASAHAVLQLAMSTSAINGTEKSSAQKATIASNEL